MILKWNENDDGMSQTNLHSTPEQGRDEPFQEGHVHYSAEDVLQIKVIWANETFYSMIFDKTW